MYKHECVQCLKAHKLRCIYGISLLDRFLGNDNIKYCPEYLQIMRYSNMKKTHNWRKK
jgi:hypothetical protein